MNEQPAMQDVPTAARRYILWPATAGEPPRDGLGNISTSGALGLMEEGSVYFTAYPKWPDARRPKDLEPGQSIQGVKYNLSGVGYYDVYRVI